MTDLSQRLADLLATVEASTTRGMPFSWQTAVQIRDELRELVGVAKALEHDRDEPDSLAVPNGRADGRGSPIERALDVLRQFDPGNAMLHSLETEDIARHLKVKIPDAEWRKLSLGDAPNPLLSPVTAAEATDARARGVILRAADFPSAVIKGGAELANTSGDDVIWACWPGHSVKSQSE